jgi:hypothetical protein
MMNAKNILLSCSMTVCMALLLFACQAGESQATDTPQVQPLPQSGKCGDQTCDEVEQKNPDLCPQDCLSAGGSSESEDEGKEEGGEPESGGGDAGLPEGCAEEEWTLTIDGCGSLQNTEPSGALCTEISACVSVDSSCNLTGTGQGQYTTCGYTSATGMCSYEVQCPSFEAPISGVVVLGGEDDLFRVKLDASRIFEIVTGTCAGKEIMTNQDFQLLQDAFGSAHRNGGGYFCEVPVSREISTGVRVQGVDAVAAGNLSYKFYAYLEKGCELAP